MMTHIRKSGKINTIFFSDIINTSKFKFIGLLIILLRSGQLFGFVSNVVFGSTQSGYIHLSNINQKCDVLLVEN